MSELLKRYLSEKIAKMQSEREAGHIEPVHVPYKALLIELKEDLRGSLNELYRDGRISVSELIDDKAIKML